MQYPKFMFKINKYFSVTSAALIFGIGVLSVVEAIMRSVFHSPTSWTLDISLYMLLVAIFLGSSYAYQEHGHVAVDFLKDLLEKKFGKKPRFVMSIVGYIIAFIVLIALIIGVGKLAISAIAQNTLTVAIVQIPITFLYIAMIIGVVVMLMTVFFIILDLFAKGEKHL